MNSVETPSDTSSRLTTPLAISLRLYLGVLFIWAGVDKFGDHAFLNTDVVGGSFVPGSLAGIIEASKANNPPFKFALDLIDSQVVLAGIGVALAEIVIGLAILIGYRTRWAALAGAAIMGSFVLTVNWIGSGNWYENVNVAAMFAFVGLAAKPITKWSVQSHTSAARRGLLGQGLIALAMIAGSGLIAAAARILGRSESTTQDNATSTTTPPAGGSTTPSPSNGTTLTTTTQIQQEGVVAISLGDNKNGWATTNDAGDVVAWSNICTHNGCKVNYAPNANGLACPCHGGLFDAKTGQPLRGPATRGLATIDVTVDADGNVRSV
jgi:thiosulfate dehydrogenase [quinone] large subunit